MVPALEEILRDTRSLVFFGGAGVSTDELVLIRFALAAALLWPVVLVRPGPPPAYEPVTRGGAKEAWPMWSADGRTVYGG